MVLFDLGMISGERAAQDYMLRHNQIVQGQQQLYKENNWQQNVMPSYHTALAAQNQHLTQRANLGMQLEGLQHVGDMTRTQIGNTLSQNDWQRLPQTIQAINQGQDAYLQNNEAIFRVMDAGRNIYDFETQLANGQLTDPINFANAFGKAFGATPVKDASGQLYGRLPDGRVIPYAQLKSNVQTQLQHLGTGAAQNRAIMGTWSGTDATGHNVTDGIVPLNISGYSGYAYGSGRGAGGAGGAGSVTGTVRTTTGSSGSLTVGGKADNGAINVQTANDIIGGASAAVGGTASVGTVRGTNTGSTSVTTRTVVPQQVVPQVGYPVIQVPQGVNVGTYNIPVIPVQQPALATQPVGASATGGTQATTQTVNTTPTQQDTFNNVSDILASSLSADDIAKRIDLTHNMGALDADTEQQTRKLVSNMIGGLRHTTQQINDLSGEYSVDNILDKEQQTLEPFVVQLAGLRQQKAKIPQGSTNHYVVDQAIAAVEKQMEDVRRQTNNLLAERYMTTDRDKARVNNQIMLNNVRQANAQLQQDLSYWLGGGE